MRNKDENRGRLENLKGRVKQAVGTVTGNRGMEADGAADRLKGAAQEAAGKVKRRIEQDDEDDDIE